MSDWFEEGGTGNPADVAALLEGAGVTEAMAAIVQHGALLSIGATSDGGAVGFTVTMDSRWRREYFREPEALTDWLAGAASAAETEAQRLAASNAPRKRQRRS